MGIEEADIVGNRAGKQYIVLQHRSHHLAQAPDADLPHAHATDQDIPGGGRQDAKQNIHQRGLAAPGGTDERNRVARLDPDVDVVEDRGLAVAVTIAKTHGLDAARQRGVVRQLRGRADFRFGQDDVGQPFALQLQHLHFEELVDQRADPAVELSLVGDKRHEDANAEVTVEDKLGAQPDDQDMLDPEQQPVQGAIEQLQLLGAQVGIDLVDQEREPRGAALVLSLEQLDGFDAAHRFEEMTLLLCRVDDLLLGCRAQGAVPRGPRQRVQRHGAHRDAAQHGAVDEHHDQRDGGHHAIEDRFQERGGERVLNLVDGAKARYHVAEVAFLEVLHRQPYQVGKDIGAPLDIESGPHVHDDPGTHRANRLLQQHEHSEAYGQRGQQVAVGRHDHVIDHPLQKKRPDQGKDLERQRQHQDLGKRPCQSRDASHQTAQLDTRDLIAGLKTRARPQLERDARKGLRHLGHGDLAHAERRVVHHDGLGSDLLEHDKVVEVPVQDARQAQFGQVVQFQLEGARLECQLARDAHHVRQLGALERDGKLAPQGSHIGPVAVVGADHPEAGQPAFRRLGLQDQGQLAAEVEREDPFVQPSRLLHDVGVQQHARLQRLGLAVSLVGLRCQADSDAVNRLAGRRGGIAQFTGRQGCLRYRQDRAARVAEFLIRERLVAQQHLVARFDKTDRAAGRIQVRLHGGPGWNQIEQGLARIDGLADVGGHCRGGAIGRRLDHQVPLGFAFGEFLFGAGNAAVELGQLILLAQGQAGHVIFLDRQLARERQPGVPRHAVLRQFDPAGLPFDLGRQLGDFQHQAIDLVAQRLLLFALEQPRLVGLFLQGLPPPRDAGADIGLDRAVAVVALAGDHVQHLAAPDLLAFAHPFIEHDAGLGRVDLDQARIGRELSRDRYPLGVGAPAQEAHHQRTARSCSWCDFFRMDCDETLEADRRGAGQRDAARIPACNGKATGAAGVRRWRVDGPRCGKHPAGRPFDGGKQRARSAAAVQGQGKSGRHGKAAGDGVRHVVARIAAPAGDRAANQAGYEVLLALPLLRTGSQQTMQHGFHLFAVQRGTGSHQEAALAAGSAGVARQRVEYRPQADQVRRRRVIPDVVQVGRDLRFGRAGIDIEPFLAIARQHAGDRAVDGAAQRSVHTLLRQVPRGIEAAAKMVAKRVDRLFERLQFIPGGGTARYHHDLGPGRQGGAGAKIEQGPVQADVGRGIAAGRKPVHIRIGQLLGPMAREAGALRRQPFRAQQPGELGKHVLDAFEIECAFLGIRRMKTGGAFQMRGPHKTCTHEQDAPLGGGDVDRVVPMRGRVVPVLDHAGIDQGQGGNGRVRELGADHFRKNSFAQTFFQVTIDQRGAAAAAVGADPHAAVAVRIPGRIRPVLARPGGQRHGACRQQMGAVRRDVAAQRMECRVVQHGALVKPQQPGAGRTVQRHRHRVRARAEQLDALFQRHARQRRTFAALPAGEVDRLRRAETGIRINRHFVGRNPVQKIIDHGAHVAARTQDLDDAQALAFVPLVHGQRIGGTRSAAHGMGRQPAPDDQGAGPSVGIGMDAALAQCQRRIDELYSRSQRRVGIFTRLAQDRDSTADLTAPARGVEREQRLLQEPDGSGGSGRRGEQRMAPPGGDAFGNPLAALGPEIGDLVEGGEKSVAHVRQGERKAAMRDHQLRDPQVRSGTPVCQAETGILPGQHGRDMGRRQRHPAHIADGAAGVVEKQGNLIQLGRLLPRVPQRRNRQRPAMPQAQRLAHHQSQQHAALGGGVSGKAYLVKNISQRMHRSVPLHYSAATSKYLTARARFFRGKFSNHQDNHEINCRRRENRARTHRRATHGTHNHREQNSEYHGCAAGDEATDRAADTADRATRQCAGNGANAASSSACVTSGHGATDGARHGARTGASHCTTPAPGKAPVGAADSIDFKLISGGCGRRAGRSVIPAAHCKRGSSARQIFHQRPVVDPGDCHARQDPLRHRRRHPVLGHVAGGVLGSQHVAKHNRNVDPLRHQMIGVVHARILGKTGGRPGGVVLVAVRAGARSGDPPGRSQPHQLDPERRRAARYLEHGADPRRLAVARHARWPVPVRRCQLRALPSQAEPGGGLACAGERRSAGQLQPGRDVAGAGGWPGRGTAFRARSDGVDRVDGPRPYDRVWASHRRGVFYYDRASRQLVRIEGAGMQGGLLQSPDGRMWVTDDDGIVRHVPMPAQGQQLPRAPDFNQGQSRNAGQFDREGNLWALLCPQGVCRVARADSLPGRAIDPVRHATDRLDQPWQLTDLIASDVLEDREGNIWVATRSGLDRFRENKLIAVKIPGATGELSVASDGSGKLWLAEWWSRAIWTIGADGVPVRDPQRRGMSLARDRDGAVLIAGSRDIERIYQGRSTRLPLPAPGGKPADLLVLGVLDDGNTLWMASPQTSLVGYRHGQWLTRDKFNLPQRIFMSAAGGTGQLWLSNNDGSLTFYDNDKLTRYDIAAVGQESGIFPGPQLVVGGERGIAVLRDNRFVQLGPVNAEALRNVSGMAVTPDGDRWLNGAKGLVHVRRNDWEASVRTPSVPLVYEVFDALEGYPGRAEVSNRQTSLYNMGKGVLWLRATGGMVRLDTTLLRPNTVRPIVQLLRVKTEQQAYPATALLQLPPDSRNFSIQYTAPGLRKPEGMQFQYKLDGVDQQRTDQRSGGVDGNRYRAHDCAVVVVPAPVPGRHPAVPVRLVQIPSAQDHGRNCRPADGAHGRARTHRAHPARYLPAKRAGAGAARVRGTDQAARGQRAARPAGSDPRRSRPHHRRGPRPGAAVAQRSRPRTATAPARHGTGCAARRRGVRAVRARRAAPVVAAGAGRAVRDRPGSAAQCLPACAGHAGDGAHRLRRRRLIVESRRQRSRPRPAGGPRAAQGAPFRHGRHARARQARGRHHRHRQCPRPGHHHRTEGVGSAQLCSRRLNRERPARTPSRRRRRPGSDRLAADRLADDRLARRAGSAGVEPDDAIAAGFLGSVHRSVGRRQQLPGVRAIGRKGRHACRQRDHRRPRPAGVVQRSELGAPVVHALDGRLRAAGAHDDDEFLAAEPAGGIGRARPARQQFPQRAQHFIARAVSIRVVDGLEVVDVDHDDGKLLAAAGSQADLLVQHFIEKPPVVEVGQRIAYHLLLQQPPHVLDLAQLAAQLGVGRFQRQRAQFDVGNIAHQQHVAEQFAVVVQDGEDAQLQVARLVQLQFDARGAVIDDGPADVELGQLLAQRFADGDLVGAVQQRAHGRVDVHDAAPGVDHDETVGNGGGDFFARHRHQVHQSAPEQRHRQQGARGRQPQRRQVHVIRQQAQPESQVAHQRDQDRHQNVGSLAPLDQARAQIKPGQQHDGLADQGIGIQRVRPVQRATDEDAVFGAAAPGIIKIVVQARIGHRRQHDGRFDGQRGQLRARGPRCLAGRRERKHQRGRRNQHDAGENQPGPQKQGVRIAHVGQRPPSGTRLESGLKMLSSKHSTARGRCGKFHWMARSVARACLAWPGLAWPGLALQRAATARTGRRRGRAVRRLRFRRIRQPVRHHRSDDCLQQVNRPALAGLAGTRLHFALGDAEDRRNGADIDRVQRSAVQRADGDGRQRRRQVPQRRIHGGESGRCAQVIGKLHHAGAGIADDRARAGHVIDPVDGVAVQGLGHHAGLAADHHHCRCHQAGDQSADDGCFLSLHAYSSNEFIKTRFIWPAVVLDIVHRREREDRYGIDLLALRVFLGGADVVQLRIAAHELAGGGIGQHQRRMLMQQPLLELLARQAVGAHVDLDQADRIAVPGAGNQDVFARDFARHHAKRHLLVDDDALGKLVLLERGFDVVLLGIRDVGQAVPARPLVRRHALVRIGWQLAVVIDHGAVRRREKVGRARSDAVQLVIAQHQRARTARLVPGELRPVHLAPVFVPVFVRKVGIVFQSQRTGAPVGEMDAVAAFAGGRPGVERPVAARRIVDAADERAGNDQRLAGGADGRVQGRAMQIVCAVEINGHGVRPVGCLDCWTGYLTVPQRVRALDIARSGLLAGEGVAGAVQRAVCTTHSNDGVYHQACFSTSLDEHNCSSRGVERSPASLSHWQRPGHAADQPGTLGMDRQLPRSGNVERRGAKDRCQAGHDPGSRPSWQNSRGHHSAQKHSSATQGSVHGRSAGRPGDRYEQLLPDPARRPYQRAGDRRSHGKRMGPATPGSLAQNSSVLRQASVAVPGKTECGMALCADVPFATCAAMWPSAGTLTTPGYKRGRALRQVVHRFCSEVAIAVFHALAKLEQSGYAIDISLHLTAA
uniref:Uncharacterized protein n=1 Tax=Tanacetum cinerariifolium TaxID=118510 RepID=A0A699GJW6_TANCI|nr:hypothetical protein [Tanacetum cinerariifolium]